MVVGVYAVHSSSPSPLELLQVPALAAGALFLTPREARLAPKASSLRPATRVEEGFSTGAYESNLA